MKLGKSKLRIFVLFVIMINSSLINATPIIDVESTTQSQALTQEKLPCHTDYSIEESPSKQAKCETGSIICIQTCIAFIEPSFGIFSILNVHSYIISPEYSVLNFEPEALYRPPKV